MTGKLNKAQWKEKGKRDLVNGVQKSLTPFLVSSSTSLSSSLTSHDSDSLKTVLKHLVEDYLGDNFKVLSDFMNFMKKDVSTITADDIKSLTASKFLSSEEIKEVRELSSNIKKRRRSYSIEQKNVLIRIALKFQRIEHSIPYIRNLPSCESINHSMLLKWIRSQYGPVKKKKKCGPKVSVEFEEEVWAECIFYQLEPGRAGGK